MMQSDCGSGQHVPSAHADEMMNRPFPHVTGEATPAVMRLAPATHRISSVRISASPKKVELKKMPRYGRSLSYLVDSCGW